MSRSVPVNFKVLGDTIWWWSVRTEKWRHWKRCQSDSWQHMTSTTRREAYENDMGDGIVEKRTERLGDSNSSSKYEAIFPRKARQLYTTPCRLSFHQSYQNNTTRWAKISVRCLFLVSSKMLLSEKSTTCAILGNGNYDGIYSYFQYGDPCACQLVSNFLCDSYFKSEKIYYETV